MRLFKTTKTLPTNWYQDTHTAITEATTHTDITLLKEALEHQCRDFFVTRRDQAASWLLVAYCDLRYKHLTMRLKNRANPTDHYLQTRTNHLS